MQTKFPDGFFEETKKLYALAELINKDEIINNKDNKIRHLENVIRGFKSQRTIRKKKWKH